MPWCHLILWCLSSIRLFSPVDAFPCVYVHALTAHQVSFTSVYNIKHRRIYFREYFIFYELSNIGWVIKFQWITFLLNEIYCEAKWKSLYAFVHSSVFKWNWGSTSVFSLFVCMFVCHRCCSLYCAIYVMCTHGMTQRFLHLWFSSSLFPSPNSRNVNEIARTQRFSEEHCQVLELLLLLQLLLLLLLLLLSFVDKIF